MSDWHQLRGKFITLEGIDGCGKSTQAKLLARHLRRQGLKVVETREPGGTPIGQEIRRLLLHPDHHAMAPQAELLLFLADRLQHLHQLIRPALAQGAVVVCDRYQDSTIAYQHHGRQLPMAPYLPLYQSQILTPHLTFWLDLPVEAAFARLARRHQTAQGAPSREESRLEEQGPFMEAVRQGFGQLATASEGRMVRVEAQAGAKTIALQLRQHLRQALKGRLGRPTA